MKKINSNFGNKKIDIDIFLIYKLFILNKYYLLKNKSHFRLKKKYYKINNTGIGKTIIPLILYIFSDNIARVDLLDKILHIDIISLKPNLIRFFLYGAVNLELTKNLLAILFKYVIAVLLLYCQINST